MKASFKKLCQGYELFREKYASGDTSVMQLLSLIGQQPTTMVVACCDSRVDPALILQCDPGDLFVVRNVANIVPPYEKDAGHHGTSAALEFGINFLQVKHLILFGHSQCGGIQALLNGTTAENDFIEPWMSLVKTDHPKEITADDYAKLALHQSYEHCLTFPWIKKRIDEGKLILHRWFFDIKSGEIFTYSLTEKNFIPLREI